MNNGYGVLFDKKEECLKLADQILKQYEGVFGAGCFPELMQFSENRTYLVRDLSGRRRAVLRLCRPGYHTADELYAEIRWLLRLNRDMEPRERTADTPVPPPGLEIPVPVADSDGRYVHGAAAEDGLLYYGVVFRYLTGRLLEDLTLDGQAVWFGRIGEAAAFLHRQVRGWTASRDMRRVSWTYETMLGNNAVWGDWRSVSALTRQGYDILKAADRRIRAKLEEYGTAENRYGLIHADLRAANLLTDGGCLKIIDFDDCGYGWYMQDLAASLSFIETLDIVPLLITEWLKGYGRILEPNEEDRRMIPTFIMMRRLQLLAWVSSRRASDAVRFREDDFAAGTVELAERYLDGWLSGL